MKRIRLLIDVMIKEDDIAQYQKIVADQPLVAMVIEDFDIRTVGRFIGAQEVSEPEHYGASNASSEVH